MYFIAFDDLPSFNPLDWSIAILFLYINTCKAFSFTYFMSLFAIDASILLNARKVILTAGLVLATLQSNRGFESFHVFYSFLDSEDEVELQSHSANIFNAANIHLIDIKAFYICFNCRIYLTAKF